MSVETVSQQAVAILDVLNDADQEWEERSRSLFGVLGWLWDVVAEPVLTALPSAGIVGTDAARPRVWWCPTGQLSLLPVHAAGRYPGESGAPGSTQCVPDRVISSYTPTLTSLIRARRSLVPEPVRHLAVGVAAAPGLPPLRAVPAELDVLTRYFTPGQDNRQLAESGATRGTVMAALSDCSWVHLACHASQQQADPDASGFALWDGPLTISDLASQPGRHRDLAFLSACQTASGSLQHLDEAIHLAAAMQFHGYRHVIATMWSVADLPSPAIADRFYAFLAKGGKPESGRAAEAIDSAVAALRAIRGVGPLVWVPYIHLGP